MLRIVLMSQHLDDEIFSESLLLFGVVLSNWFTKSSTITEGF